MRVRPSSERRGNLTIGGVAVHSIAGRPVSSLAALAAARAVPTKPSTARPGKPTSKTHLNTLKPNTLPPSPSPQNKPHKLASQPSIKGIPQSKNAPVSHPNTATATAIKRQSVQNTAFQAAKAVKALLANSLVATTASKQKRELNSRHGASLLRLLLLDSVLSTSSIATAQSSVHISFKEDGSIVGKPKKTNKVEMGTVGGITFGSKISRKPETEKIVQRRPLKEIKFARTNLGPGLEKVIVKYGNGKMQLMQKNIEVPKNVKSRDVDSEMVDFRRRRKDSNLVETVQPKMVVEELKTESRIIVRKISLTKSLSVAFCCAS